MMKKITSVLLLILALMSFVACIGRGIDSTTKQTVLPENQQLKVGFSLPSLTFPYYARMYDEMEKEAKARNWDLSFVDGNLDTTTQLNGLQDMINNNIKVLVLASWWIDAMTDIFAQCKEKNIPVFVLDTIVIPNGCEKAITMTTGTDNYNAGIVGGTWYAGELAKQGKNTINMVCISSVQELPYKRCLGFMDGLKNNGIKVNLLNNYDSGSREKAMSLTEDALTAFPSPEIDLIFGSSAQDSLGVYDATAGAKRTEVLVFGFDGEDEELEKIDGKTNYIATITQDPRGQAKLTAQCITKWQNGESFPQIQEAQAGVYCRDGQLTGAEIVKK